MLNLQKPVFGLEILYKINENYPEILLEYWGSEVVNSPLKWFVTASKKALEMGGKFICVAFNIEDETEIENCKKTLSEIVKTAQLPIIIKGSGQKDLDAILLPELISLLNKPSIIAPVQDNNYKAIVNSIVNAPVDGHFAVLRTPIDINLTKELNVLSIDEGLNKEQILIDPDMGCVGYGLDYGYSIIERIIEAKNAGDKMLDMPIIVFAGSESYKAKEAKSPDFPPSFGDINTRSIAWEISTTTSLICAGANIAVVWHPEALKVLNDMFSGGN